MCGDTPPPANNLASGTLHPQESWDLPGKLTFAAPNLNCGALHHRGAWDLHRDLAPWLYSLDQQVLLSSRCDHWRSLSWPVLGDICGSLHIPKCDWCRAMPAPECYRVHGDVPIPEHHGTCGPQLYQGHDQGCRHPPVHASTSLPEHPHLHHHGAVPSQVSNVAARQEVSDVRGHTVKRLLCINKTSSSEFLGFSCVSTRNNIASCWIKNAFQSSVNYGPYFYCLMLTAIIMAKVQRKFYLHSQRPIS